MSKHIDYAYKSYVLREHNDLLTKIIRTDKMEYAKSLTFNYVSEFGELVRVEHPSYIYHIKKGTLNYSQLMDYVISNGLLREYAECRKINKARNNKVYRLRNKIESIICNGDCLFLTLTFTDKVLETTTPQQRRRYVREFLSSYHCSYVGNVDYGKTNHREHYHVVIGTNNVNHKDWRYGAINFERVRVSEKTSCGCLSKYIAKLSNHAIKETTKRSALLYSRV